jgi:CrcB protein
MKMVLVAVFGSLGALSRYGIAVWVGPRSFPYATLAINLIGSFALGVVLTLATQRLRPDLAAGLAIGFLGAFTTFSTLSWDSFSLLRDGRPAAALTNVVVSMIAGVAAAALGYIVADHFVDGPPETGSEQAIITEHTPGGDVTN